MAPVLSKPLVFIDDGCRVEFPAGTPVEVVDPEVALAGDPFRLAMVREHLAERRRRFRPGVAVLIGGRVRTISARLIEGGGR